MRTRHLALILVSLLGCSKAEAPPAPVPDTAAAPAAGGLELDLRWDRRARTLEVHGIPGAGQAWELFAQAAEAAGAERLVVAHPGKDADLPDGLGLVWPKLLALEGLTLHVDAGLVEATGVARNKAHADEAEGQLAALFGKNRSTRVTVVVEPTALDEGEGRLMTSDGKSIAALAPKRLGKGASGEVAQTDEHGRLLDGLYELADGRTVVVEPGRMATVPASSEGPAIVVDGRRFQLDLGDTSKIEGSIKVVLPTDEGGLGFEGAKTPDGMPASGPRYLKPGERFDPGTLADERRRRDQVQALVIGASGTADAAASDRALLGRSLSTHFIIDFDGTIYETLDPIHCAYYAGEANLRSVMVDLVMPSGDLLEEPTLPAYPPEHPRAAEMAAHPRGGPAEALIHGKARKHWGPTEAQYRSLVALTRTLATIFPTLREGPPKLDGKVSLAAAEPRGVVGMLHVLEDKTSPGAAFDWARLEPALTPPPAITAAPIAVAPLRERAASAPGEGGKVQISWSYLDGLEVRGLPNEGAVVDAALAKVEALGVRRVRFLEPAPSQFTEAEQGALIEAALLLASGDLEIGPSVGANVPDSERRGLVYVTGRVLHRHTRAAIGEVMKRVPGVRAVLDLPRGDALTVPGAGVLDLGEDYDVEAHELAANVVPLTAVPSGEVVTPDPAGRVAPGLYALPDGTLAAVHLGHRTTVSLEAPSVTIGGRRFRLDYDVKKVVGPGDPGALTFAGKPRAEGASLEALRGAIRQVVIGADVADDTAQGHAQITKAGASAHFMIDFDGTLYQTLDPAELGAGMTPGAVYVVLNHRLRNLEKDPDAPAYPADHPRASEMAAHPRGGPYSGRIHGVRVETFGYTTAQYSTLGALLRRLTEVFPRLGAGLPWTPAGDAFSGVLYEDHDGIVYAYHLHMDRWDPGPALWSDYIARRLANGLAPVPFDKLGVRGARHLIERLLDLGTGGAASQEGLIRDARAQLELLEPMDWDVEQLFRGALLEAAKKDSVRLDKAAAKMIGRAIERGPRQRVLRVVRATGAELAAGPVAGFPTELRGVADDLAPEAEWYAWEIGDPSAPGDVVAGHGLVRADGRWFLAPEPWRIRR